MQPLNKYFELQVINALSSNNINQKAITV